MMQASLTPCHDKFADAACEAQESHAEEEICMEGYVDKHVSIHKKGVVTKAWKRRYLTLTGQAP